jgi:hypothetical protein
MTRHNGEPEKRAAVPDTQDRECVAHHKVLTFDTSFAVRLAQASKRVN